MGKMLVFVVSLALSVEAKKVCVTPGASCYAGAVALAVAGGAVAAAAAPVAATAGTVTTVTTAAPGIWGFLGWTTVTTTTTAGTAASGSAVVSGAAGTASSMASGEAIHGHDALAAAATDGYCGCDKWQSSYDRRLLASAMPPEPTSLQVAFVGCGMLMSVFTASSTLFGATWRMLIRFAFSGVVMSGSVILLLQLVPELIFRSEKFAFFLFIIQACYAGRVSMQYLNTLPASRYNEKAKPLIA